MQSVHRVESPSGSAREEGELTADSKKRKLPQDSAAARAPRPANPFPVQTERRFQGHWDRAPAIRTAPQQDWRRIALEEIDRRKDSDMRCRDAERELDLNRRRADHFENKAKATQASHAAAEQKAASLERELKEAQAAAGSWQMQTHGLQENLQQLMDVSQASENKQRLAEVAFQEQAKKMQKDQVTALEQMRESYSEIVSKLKDEMRHLRKEYVTVQDALKTTGDKLSKLQANNDRLFESSEEEIKKLKQHNGELTRDSNRQDGIIQQLTTEVNRVRGEKGALEQNAGRLKEQLESAQQQLASAEQKIVRLTETLHTFRRSIDAQLFKQE